MTHRHIHRHKPEEKDKSLQKILCKIAVGFFQPLFHTSPQLNPIEQLWASVKQKLKGLYRYVKEDFFEALCDAITYYSINTSGPSR